MPPYSPETLLQLLQSFPKSPTRLRQIHALLITNAHFLCKSQWKNTLLYNALIEAHLSSGQTRHSFLLFANMLAADAPPNSHTFSSLAKAAAVAARSSSFPLCPPLHGQALRRGVMADPFVATSFLALHAAIGSLSDARKVFDEMPQRNRDLVARNAMLDAYCKNGDVGSAVRFFESMPEKDVVTWTCLVNGLRVCSRYSEAVRVFERMVRCSVRPNEATYVGLLGSCVGLGLGKQVHGYVVRNETGLTVNMGTTLIDFYGKTGMTRSASNVFGQMPVKGVSAWNAAISALGSNGREREALTLFDQMKTTVGSKPNAVTLVAVLAACARGRLVELGLEVFGSMTAEFGVVPTMEHYGCVVDLLGRAGLLDEAAEFVKRMPFEPDGSVLGALRGAHRIHGGHDVARWDRANAGVERIPAYSLVV